MAVATFIANKPGLNILLFHTPAARPGTQVDWSRALPYLPQAWTWISVSAGFYMAAALAALAHPARAKRYVGWGAFLTVFAAKFLLVSAMTAKSTYPVFDRYLIIFVGPSILLFALGLESLAEWSERGKPRSGPVVIWAALGLVLFQVKPSFSSFIENARHGAALLRTMPPDYSARYHFFERLKAEKRPALILTDHCWASDIPKFYMEVFGQKPTAPYVILNTSTDACETPPADLAHALKKFASDYHATGDVAFFYETQRASRVPCGLGATPSYRLSEAICIGIIPYRQMPEKWTD